MRSARLILLATFLAAGLATPSGQQQTDAQGFRFRTGVALVNVTAVVTDRYGHVVPGLRREDFRVFEDGVEQTVTHFDRERVPVSLGIALDTSGSMAGEKMEAARAALDRFLLDLLDREDEVFLYSFDTHPRLVETWTEDRQRLSQLLRRIVPRGNTAMYDAVAEAVPLAQSGRHRKKALVVISDGNDTGSHTEIGELKQLIRETEVLVYAIGIDGRATEVTTGSGRPPGGTTFPPRGPGFPFPFPFPGRRTPPSSPPRIPPVPAPGGRVVTVGDRVNSGALRIMTDDSGGRTEIIRSPRDLDPATAGIADELSKQYYLGYPAPAQDGRWHAIRVEVRNPNYRVRARRGYMAIR
ncbi:MAG TPA: VWA domain-containing protein [Vicinamibacterales bacterium]|nr:VWA domain-containing protein [Vicinamibacterales bacterium]